MAIALDLHYGFKYEPLSGRLNDIRMWGYDRRPKMITALETSNKFWRICRDLSIEAAKAHGLFSFVLMKAKPVQWRTDDEMGEQKWSAR